jgi:hypothetical protein
MVKEYLTHRTINLKTTSPSHGKRRATGKKKKHIWKWCNFQKFPWNNTDECCLKNSLVVEIKETNLSLNSDFGSNNNKRRHIIDAKPTAIVVTTTIQPEEPEDPEEGEHIFHSQMWVKGTPLHLLLIAESIRKSSQHRSSSSWI